MYILLGDHALRDPLIKMMGEHASNIHIHKWANTPLKIYILWANTPSNRQVSDVINFRQTCQLITNKMMCPADLQRKLRALSKVIRNGTHILLALEQKANDPMQDRCMSCRFLFVSVVGRTRQSNR